MIHLVARHSLVAPIHANFETYLHSEWRYDPRFWKKSSLCARKPELFEDFGLFEGRLRTNLPICIGKEVP